jgi:hypothetical protein
MEITKAKSFKRVTNISIILPTKWHHSLAETHMIVSFLITPTYISKPDKINNLQQNTG